MPIQVLPAEEAAKIAAGEVIERPASVVKELVENALDAGATQVSIEVRDAGLGLVQVSDDGCGIPASELELAFLRHATSKLRALADLQRLTTLGFRGEALPSIAAVAEVTAVSRTADQEAGAFLLLRRGQVVERGQRGAPVGTRVTMRHLFAEVPARLKFLKSPRTELAHIQHLVCQFALAHPSVRFHLNVDGRRSFESPGTGRLLDTLVSVFGAETAASLLELAGDDLWGYISPASLGRGSRLDISFFVNRRWVQSRSLTFALEEAYHGLLSQGRHPIAVVHLRLPPAEVDVNVHPAKAEVRFRHERELFARVQRAVRQALTEHLTVPEVVGRAASPFAPTVEGSAAVAPLPLVETPFAEQPHGEPASVGGRQPAPLARRRLPILRVLGQMGNAFIVAEGPDGIYLIDQHRAHERVLYETMSSDGPAPRQGLLEPVAVHLSPRQAAFLPAAQEALEALGFDLEPFGERTYLLRAAPALLPQTDLAQVAASILDEVIEQRAAADWRENLRVALACRGAIKAGQSLATAEMRELLEKLEATSQPALCPHGATIIVHLSQAQLERQFGRR